MFKNEVPNHFGWFEEFTINEDLIMTYSYSKIEYSKIHKVERIKEQFYDFKFHFQLDLTLRDGSRVKKHVVLIEKNINKSFWSVKVLEAVFKHNQYSAFLRYCFGAFQNNEGNAEGFIGALGNQTFENQHKDTLEDRGMIKLNADTRASGKDVAAVVADISMQGNEAWGIEKLTLPILYGRYKTDDLPSTFQKILDKKGSKHTYMSKVIKPGYMERAQNLC